MRPSKEEYYLNIAKEIAQRSTCYRQKGGAVIVKKDVIVSTGYIGAPRGTKDCFERGNCLRNELKIPHGKQYEICRSVHAEQNAIINAGRSGSNFLGGDMYLWLGDKDNNPFNALPCYICKKMIMNAGIERVIGCKEDGGYQVFFIKDWVNDWRINDILDDKYQYGVEKNKREGYED